MTSLRNHFEHNSRAELYSALEKKAEKRFAKLEETLLRDITKHVASGSTEDTLFFKIVAVKDSRHERAVRQLAGYDRLHQICAAPDVDVKIELKDRGSAFGGNRKLYIVISLHKPYMESEDAPFPEYHTKHSKYEDRKPRKLPPKKPATVNNLSGKFQVTYVVKGPVAATGAVHTLKISS